MGVEGGGCWLRGMKKGVHCCFWGIESAKQRTLQRVCTKYGVWQSYDGGCLSVFSGVLHQRKQAELKQWTDHGGAHGVRFVSYN